MSLARNSYHNTNSQEDSKQIYWWLSGVYPSIVQMKTSRLFQGPNFSLQVFTQYCMDGYDMIEHKCITFSQH